MRECPIGPASTRPSPAQRGRGEAGTNLGHEVLACSLDHPQRPRFLCRVVHEEIHGPFHGFNRAQAAVVEAAILVSRLRMLPREKVDGEIAYLRTAVEKTAGPREREAWEWLMERLDAFYAEPG